MGFQVRPTSSNVISDTSLSKLLLSDDISQIWGVHRIM